MSIRAESGGRKSGQVTAGPERNAQAAWPDGLFPNALRAPGRGVAPARPCAILAGSGRKVASGLSKSRNAGRREGTLAA